MYPFQPHHLPRTAQYSSISNEKKIHQKYTPTTTKTNFYQTNYTNFSNGNKFHTQQSEISDRGLQSAGTPYDNSRYLTQSVGPMSAQAGLGTLNTGSLSEQLFKIRKERKKNEENLKLIQNRVNQLDLENKGTLKSTQLTQQKTSDLLLTKQNNYNKKNTLDINKQRQQDYIERKRQENLKSRMSHQNNRKLMQLKKQQKLQLEYQFNKSQKQRQKEEYQDMINEFSMRNQDAYRQCKEAERIKKNKLSQFQQQKLAYGQQQYQKRIEQELLQNEQNQRKIQQIENQEQELLRKLKMTQTLRDSALAQMQKVQNTPSASIQQSKIMFQSTLQYRSDTNSYYVDQGNMGSQQFQSKSQQMLIDQNQNMTPQNMETLQSEQNY